MDNKKNKYAILPVKKQKRKNEKWDKVPSHLPNGGNCFAILAVAPCKSGKSTTAINLLLNPIFNWINLFDKICIISPTVSQDLTWKPLLDILNNDEVEDNPYKDKVHIFTDDEVYNMDDIIKGIWEVQKEDTSKTCLLMVDDCLGLLKGKQGKEISRLYSRYRHASISVISMSQVFRSYDSAMRCNATGFLLWKTYNEAELKKIMEELSGIPGILEMYNKVTDKPHSFLWVNIEEQEVWDNFSHCLWKKHA